VDRIITLKNGTIDEMGAPETLAKTDGIYARLLMLQNHAGKDIDEKLAAYDMTV
jgi:ATP-binding cassette subfamily B protein